MAKRGKGKTPETGLTPKEIVRSRRLRRQNRYLFIGLGAVGVLIIGLLAAGLIQEFIMKPGSAVAVVDGVKIRTDDFQKRFRFEYNSVQGQLNQWLQLQAQYSSTDEESGGLFDQQIAQLESQLANPDMLSLQVLDRMIEEELIRQEASAEGLQVSDAEISEEVERQFGFVRNPTPTPIVTPATITTTEVITGSDGVTTTRIISSTATPMPTMALMTEAEFEQNYATGMSNLAETLDFSESDFRALIKIGLLEDKLREKMGETVPTTEEQVQARHILIRPDEEAEDQEAALQEAAAQAQAAYDRLLAGEEFEVLAQELSDDTGSAEEGGDLGWFGRGLMQPEFEDMAFSLALEEISKPFTTTFGYHIVQVLDKDPAREVDEYTLSQRQSQAFDDWLQERLETAEIERFWSEEKVPPTPRPQVVPIS